MGHGTSVQIRPRPHALGHGTAEQFEMVQYYNLYRRYMHKLDRLMGMLMVPLANVLQCKT